MAFIEQKTTPDVEQEEIKKFVSVIRSLPKEDRAILLSNANALRVRCDIEKAKETAV